MLTLHDGATLAIFEGTGMSDNIGDQLLNVIPTGRGDISGPAEWGLVGAALLIGYGVYRFLANSKIEMNGPPPPVNLNVGSKLD